jgi:hypothetical protein
MRILVYVSRQFRLWYVWQEAFVLPVVQLFVQLGLRQTEAEESSLSFNIYSVY